MAVFVVPELPELLESAESVEVVGLVGSVVVVDDVFVVPDVAVEGVVDEDPEVDDSVDELPDWLG